jgi:ADP-ribose pyrophosphatase YjhB (NUDIX family)
MDTNSNHFCAGIYLVRSLDGKYQIIGVTAKRFPNEVKLPGGTNKNSIWETPDQTLVREMLEETGLEPVRFQLVSKEEAKGHTKYFFVCLEVKGHFDGPKTVKEPDGDELTIGLWDLAEFDQYLFRNHRLAFMKACRVLMGCDSFFSKNYPGIYQKLGGVSR